MSSVRTVRRLNRILGMLPWVIANPGTTVAEVCERFGYTKAQLVADLDLVFVCGLPGYGPGDLMVAYILDDEVVVEMADYFSSPVRLTTRESLSLLASAMAIASAGNTSGALQSGIEKLQKLLLPEEADALVVDLMDPEFVEPLRKAAARGDVVRISYTAITSTLASEREIEPWRVFSTLGNWYVTAWCRLAGGERVFRVDRIRSLELTGKYFQQLEEPPDPVVRYTPTEEDVQADIRLGKLSRWVADYYPVEILADDEEGSTVRFSASDPLVPGRLLLRLGEDAELVEGAEVREALEALRGRILSRYGASE